APVLSSAIGPCHYRRKLLFAPPCAGLFLESLLLGFLALCNLLLAAVSECYQGLWWEVNKPPNRLPDPLPGCGLQCGARSIYGVCDGRDQVAGIYKGRDPGGDLTLCDDQ